MQFRVNDNLSYKGYKFSVNIAKHIQVENNLNNHYAEFYNKYVCFDGEDKCYNFSDITNKIPGMVYDGSWKFPEIVDLSNVADDMIKILEQYSEMMDTFNNSLKCAFTSNIKSARAI